MLQAQNSFQRARDQMVENDLKPRGITDQRVLEAFRQVPRHQFVDASLRFKAYEDHPLPIGHGQTISQPYVVAAMSQSLRLGDDAKVLDVGTGCGYQAAILATYCKSVYSIERVAALVGPAKRRLDNLGYNNVLVKFGDGFEGWPEYAPYDGIVVAAFGLKVPPRLIEQLKVGGRLVMPIGDSSSQALTVFRKESDAEVEQFVLGKCSFVPLVAAKA